MNTPPPLYFVWNGEVMEPIPYHRKLCDKHFVVGQRYPLTVHEERSRRSHNHYFASLHDAWLNLTDDLAMEFPTEEHLRKWALVQAGYADERSIACSSKLEARKIAAFIKPMDDYAVIVVKEATIKVYTAQSQSEKAMGKKDFAASKDAVLGVLSRLIGVTPEELQRNAEQVA